MTRKEATTRIVELAGRMETDALLVVVDQMERLAMGQDMYGDLELDDDTRDWEREGYEELLDYMIYQSCKRLKRRARAS